MWPGKHAQERPDQLAYVMAASGEAVTYRELNDRSNQLAQLLLRRGAALRRPHRGAHGEPAPSTSRSCWAAQRSGLFFTCINSHFNADEVAYILDDCDAQVLVDLRHASRRRGRARSTRCRSVKIRLMVGDGRSTATSPTRHAIALPGRAARRGARGHADALLVGHDGAAEGREVQDRRASASATHARRDGDDDDGLGHGRATPSTCRPRRCTTRRRSSIA